MALISFVFSLYNEEQTLPVLMKRIGAVMDKEPEDYEMIFVNDASTDNSVGVIENETKRSFKGKVVLVNLSRRFGVEESFMAGVGVAKGDAVILMYTDMQDPPELVHKMLVCWRDGCEVVHTVRKKRIQEHPLKKLAAFVAYRVIGKLADIKIPIDSGEFKLISRNVARNLLALPEAEPYLRGLIPWIGFKQVCLEYELQPRLVGKSKVPLFGKKAWTVFLSGVVSFSDFPVYAVLITGTVGLVFSFFLVVFLMAGGKAGWLGAQEVFMMSLWASLMFALGFIGIYVVRINKNTQGRPRSIISDIKRF